MLAKTQPTLSNLDEGILELDSPCSNKSLNNSIKWLQGDVTESILTILMNDQRNTCIHHNIFSFPSTNSNIPAIMNKSSKATLFSIAGSLAVFGVFTAASLWRDYRHHSSHSNKNDVPSQSIGDFHLVHKSTPTDSEKLKQVENTSFQYFCHALAAHLVRDQKLVRKRTQRDREDTMQAVHQIINAFFNYFYMVKGDMSVSSDHTDDCSVSSSSVSLEDLGISKTINYEWNNQEYFEKKGLERIPCSQPDSVAHVLANALVAAQAVHWNQQDLSSVHFICKCYVY